jgi:Spy/CpxP family protein refolding chaperone
MKNELKWLGSALLVGWLLLGGAAVWAAEPAAPPPAGPAVGRDAGPMGPVWIHELNLTPEQIAKLRQDRLQDRREMIKVQAELETQQLDLQEALLQDKPDLDVIEKISDRIGGIHGRMVLGRAKALIFLRSVLTPEQKQKLDALLLQYGGLGGHLGGGRRMHPGDEEEGPDGPR